jgi:hypothetical protein
MGFKGGLKGCEREQGLDRGDFFAEKSYCKKRGYKEKARSL